MIYIYGKRTKEIKLKYFLKYKFISLFSKSIRCQQQFGFILQKDNVHNRLFNDYSQRQKMLYILGQKYLANEAKQYPFFPIINPYYPSFGYYYPVEKEPTYMKIIPKKINLLMNSRYYSPFPGKTYTQKNFKKLRRTFPGTHKFRDSLKTNTMTQPLKTYSNKLDDSLMKTSESLYKQIQRYPTKRSNFILDSVEEEANILDNGRKIFSVPQKLKGKNFKINKKSGFPKLNSNRGFFSNDMKKSNSSIKSLFNFDGIGNFSQGYSSDFKTSLNKVDNNNNCLIRSYNNETKSSLFSPISLSYEANDMQKFLRKKISSYKYLTIKKDKELNNNTLSILNTNPTSSYSKKKNNNSKNLIKKNNTITKSISYNKFNNDSLTNKRLFNNSLKLNTYGSDSEIIINAKDYYNNEELTHDSINSIQRNYQSLNRPLNFNLNSTNETVRFIGNLNDINSNYNSNGYLLNSRQKKTYPNLDNNSLNNYFDKKGKFDLYNSSLRDNYNNNLQISTGFSRKDTGSKIGSTDNKSSRTNTQKRKGIDSKFNNYINFRLKEELSPNTQNRITLEKTVKSKKGNYVTISNEPIDIKRKRKDENYEMNLFGSKENTINFNIKGKMSSNKSSSKTQSHFNYDKLQVVGNVVNENFDDFYRYKISDSESRHSSQKSDKLTIQSLNDSKMLEVANYYINNDERTDKNQISSILNHKKNSKNKNKKKFFYKK